MRHALRGHDVETAYERAWSRLTNGELISAAEEAGFDVFVTTDRSLRHQQNLAGRRLAIVVLMSASWPRIQRVVHTVVEAVDAATPGGYREVEVAGG